MLRTLLTTLLLLAFSLMQSMLGQSVQVLGVAQDAGYPQADCQKECCQEAWKYPQNKRMVSCLAVEDGAGGFYMLDATPDFPDQLQIMRKRGLTLKGIFLTHAHIGHYIGLMHLGREVMGVTEVPVYAMPRMIQFLQENGPWSQLVELNNIRLMPLTNEEPVNLGPIQITPFLVPHRDEFSETVGFAIKGSKKEGLFIPDIDKWSKWKEDLKNKVMQSDFAFLDGTFFENGELPGRDMSEIPHPFVEETMQLLKPLHAIHKSKVYFIHFNHTNPLLRLGSDAVKRVEEQGFRVATEGLRLRIGLGKL